MALFLCAELANGVCTTWIEHRELIPPLTVAEGLSLGWRVLACYATAWGCNLLIRFLWTHERY